MQVPEVIERSHAQAERGHATSSRPVEVILSLDVLLYDISDGIERTARPYVDEKEPLREKPFAVLNQL